MRDFDDSFTLRSFELGNKLWLGVNRKLLTVVRQPAITEVPNTLEHFLGIANIDGTMIPAYDLQAWVGWGRCTSPDFILIGTSSDTVAFSVTRLTDTPKTFSEHVAAGQADVPDLLKPMTDGTVCSSDEYYYVMHLEAVAQGLLRSVVARDMEAVES